MRMRFVTAVETQGELCAHAIQQYRGTQLDGPGWNLEILLGFLNHMYTVRSSNTENEMKGLIMGSSKCAHCGKAGHDKENCWALHPKKRYDNGMKSKSSTIKCYDCGKTGHIKRNCPGKEKSNVIATLNDNDTDVIDCYMRTFVDSGSSCHTVTDLNLLGAGTIAETNETVNSVNGLTIRLTHKGERTIDTDQGVIRLKEVYFAKDIKYNLLSVPVMTKKGVKLILGKTDSYIDKNGTRINLEKVDGLWALPEGKRQNTVATLRMELGGKADAETWHRRLGHVSNYKVKQMISKGLVTDDAGKYDAAECETCKLTNPKKRPVPSNAERSGNVTVQVDFMPMGHDCKGLNGEIGAYVYSRKYSKIMKSYPVKTASTKEAVLALDAFCTGVLPFLGENVDCIQTDAGTQFMSREWGDMCRKQRIMHRTCPVDHQAMNGQVERAQGILIAKTRALLRDSGLERKFWPLAMGTATYLIYRTPHDNLGGLSLWK